MQDLNKQQIILLCILISFVVSIATGIMTTSLLMQAPVELTQTVNRVVERTVETVTQAPTPTNPNPTPTQVQTVVVSEDDSVTKAIEKNAPSVVRIHAANADGSIDEIYGIGLVVSTNGMIAGDKKFISPVMTYSAIMSDNTEIPLVPIDGNKGDVVGFFQAKPVKAYTFTPAVLFTGDAKLGQTVIAIGGNTTNAVNVGRVISLNMKDAPSVGTSTPTKYVSSIETDVTPTDSIDGAPILSLTGSIIGMSLSQYSSSKSYLPASIIKSQADQIKVAQ